jgi:hypothetical protein
VIAIPAAATRKRDRNANATQDNGPDIEPVAGPSTATITAQQNDLVDDSDDEDESARLEEIRKHEVSPDTCRLWLADDF